MDKMINAPERLPQNLKQAMATANISAADLARKSGVSMASLSRILSGQVNPSLGHMMRISQALNVSLDKLVGTPNLSVHSKPVLDYTLDEEKESAVATRTRAETDILVTFVLENTGMKPAEAARLLSSAATGSWVESWTESYVDHSHVVKPRPVVAMEIAPRTISVDVAFPQELFEAGSIVNLISVISASCTSTGARIDDIRIPPILLRTYKGPMFGIQGMRDFMGKYGRPLISTTLRPTIGLSPKMYGKAAYEALKGGVDMTCDPTLLHDLPSNTWQERFSFLRDAVTTASNETGEKKIHAANISAATVEEMLERAEFVSGAGLGAVLVDSGAVGWTALQSIARFCRKDGLFLCAMGGRVLNNGPLSNQLVAKLLRFAGCDVVSVGSPLRGDAAKRRIVNGIVRALSGEDMPAYPEGDIIYDQPTCGIRAAFPACGGGHNAWHLPQLIDALGHDVILQCGGSVMGHPWGSMAGAIAMRTAVEALVQAQIEGAALAVEGRIVLERAAKNSPDLAEALRFWREGSFLFGVIDGAETGPVEGMVIATTKPSKPKLKPVPTEPEADA